MKPHNGWLPRAVAALFVAMLITPPLAPATWAAAPVSITMKTSVRGSILDLTITAQFPITVQLGVKNPATGATFQWDFGDGTNSTDAAPPHTYNSAFVYEISLVMSSPNGTVSSGKVKFAAMDARGQNGAIAVYPPRGTYGFVPLGVGGAYFAPQALVSLLMNGSVIANVRADNGGIWKFDASHALPAAPNGTKYMFSTNPQSLVRKFTTVEGIRGSPTSGSPGDSVLVEGRSYPPSSSVDVFLNGVYIGTGQTDDLGSFIAGLTLPFSPSLSGGGHYPYATLPPVLGTQASFTITGFGIAGGLQNWWWLILLIAGALMIYFFVIRPARARPVSLASSPTSP